MLEIVSVTLQYQIGNASPVPVLKEFCLRIMPGEILGLVGESGSGKTSAALSILGLQGEGGCITSGSILWQKRNITHWHEADLRTIRGREIAFIFQQPQASLNPVYSVSEELVSLLVMHRGIRGQAAQRVANTLLKQVGIDDISRVSKLYPHQLSGGMAQRIMIAMALACQPKLLIADEPTASLDVTIQAQIMDLLLEVREQTGMAILLISHDLAVVAGLCDRVAVMYQGRVVELGTAENIYTASAHPYTRALLAAMPQLKKRRLDRRYKQRELAPARAMACAYAPHCQRTVADCMTAIPPMAEITPNHLAACWHLKDNLDIEHK